MKTNLESLYRELGVIYQFDSNYKYIGTFLWVEQAKQFGYSVKEVAAAAFNHELTKDGYYFVSSPICNIEDVRIETTQQCVLQINKLGLVECIHRTAADAAIDYGKGLYLCLNLLRRTAGGFYWRKVSKEYIKFLPYIDNINRYIKHTEPQTDEVTFYRDLKEASEDTLLTEDEIYDAIFTPNHYDENEWQYIRTTLDFEQLQDKSLKEIQAENSLMQLLPFNNDKCLVGNVKRFMESYSDNDVLMLSNDDKLTVLGEFNSIHQAEIETTFTNIWPCVKKKKGHKTAGGFRWMYRKDYDELKKQLENELS